MSKSFYLEELMKFYKETKLFVPLEKIKGINAVLTIIVSLFSFVSITLSEPHFSFLKKIYNNIFYNNYRLCNEKSS